MDIKESIKEQWFTNYTVIFGVRTLESLGYCAGIKNCFCCYRHQHLFYIS